MSLEKDIEIKKAKRIIVDNAIFGIYQDNDGYEFHVKVNLEDLEFIKFDANGSDIGIAAIGSILTAIAEGVNQFMEKTPDITDDLIKNLRRVRFSFVMYAGVVGFVYSGGTQGVEEMIQAIVFEVAMYLFGSLVTYSISTWLLAILVAAIITFIMNVILTKNNREKVVAFMEKIIEIIKTNLLKIKQVLIRLKDDIFSFFLRLQEFWNNLCEDIMSEYFSEQSFEDLLEYVGCRRDNCNAWFAFMNDDFGINNAESIANERGEALQSYKDRRQAAFDRSVEFNRNKHKLSYTATKPPMTKLMA